MLTSAIVALVVGQTLSGPKIVVTLSQGRTVTIQTNAKESPKTVNYITNLVKQNFYSGILVHRVESWVVQWGDPLTKKPTGLNTSGVGGGGTGKSMPFETSKVSFKRGVVGIASTGMKVGGDCQIFILTKDAPHLDGNYAVLGRVTDGMKVVDGIRPGDKIVSMRVVGGSARR